MFLVPFVAEALVISTAAATAIVAVGTVAVSFGINYAISLLQKKPDQAQTGGGVQLDIQADADVPQSLLVGHATTAGSLIYAETFGKRGTIDNSDMAQIIAIADHPCTELVTQFVESQEVTLTPAATGTHDKTFNTDAENRGFTVDGYGDKLAMQFYDGTQTAADAFTVAALSGHPERPWTSAMVGRGRSYVRVHSIYDISSQALVQGPLSWRFVVKGIKLYDPRKDTTAGGSGSHRWNDLDTHEWTSNLAVIAYNILRGIRVKDSTGTPKHFYGLENTTAAALPFDNWVAAMNEADVAVDGEQQFHGGAEIPVNTEPLEAVRGLLQACGGRLSELGGVFKLYLGAPGLPVLTFTDGDLRANEGDNYKPILKLDQRVNYVTGKYTAPEDGWVPKIAPPREDATRAAADGRRVSADLDVPWVQSPFHMQRLMKQLLARAQRERRHVVPLPPAAFGTEAGDSVEWTSTLNGYTDKLFEVDSVDLLPNFDTMVSIIEVDHTDYDWDAVTDYIAQPVGSLTTARPSLKIIEGFDAIGVTDTGANGTQRPACKLTWTPPEDGDLVGVAWQLRKAAVPAEVMPGSVNDIETVQAGEVIIVGGLQSVTDYEIRARFISFSGYGTDWSLWIAFTTPQGLLSSEEFVAGLIKIAFANLDKELRSYILQNEQGSQIAADIAAQAFVQSKNDKDFMLSKLAQVQAQLATTIGVVADDLHRLESKVDANIAEDAIHAQALQDLTTRVVFDEGVISIIAAEVTNLSAVLDDTSTNMDSLVTAADTLVTTIESSSTLTSLLGQQVTDVRANLSNTRARLQGTADALTALISNVEADETQITILGQQIVALSANLSATQSGLTALANSVTTLTSRITSDEAATTALSSQVTALDASLTDTRTSLNATANSLTTLTSRVTSVEGSVTSLSASVTQVSTRVTNLEGTIAANSSAISSLNTQTSSINGALSTQAQSITQIQSSVGSLSSTVTTESNTRANQFGQLVGLWSVRADVNGVVTGIQVLTESGAQGQILSQISFQADKIFFKAPNGSPVSVFSLTPDGGTLFLRGDIIADGTITSSKLVAGAINTSSLIAQNVIVTGNLQADAATAVSAVVGPNVTTPRVNSSSPAGTIDLVSLTFDVRVGRLLIDVGIEVNNHIGNNPEDFTVDILVNGTIIRTVAFHARVDGGFNQAGNPNVFTATWAIIESTTISSYYASAPIGNIPISARVNYARGGLNGGVNYTFIAPFLRVMESRR